jgi:hypothetical protein
MPLSEVKAKSIFELLLVAGRPTENQRQEYRKEDKVNRLLNELVEEDLF